MKLAKDRTKPAWFHLTMGLLASALAGQAAAQNAQAPKDLKALHDKITKPGTTISVADGQAALEKLKEWKLSPGALNDAQRDQLARTELYAALAIGDARRAVASLNYLLKSGAPGAPETLVAACAVACAAGDAKLGDSMLEKRSQTAGNEDEKKAFSAQRRRFRKVGTPAPDVTISPEDGADVSPANRNGVVLLLDFWNLRKKPEEKQIAALRDLQNAFKEETHFELLGINTDSASKLDDARSFARGGGYAWKQHYEKKTDGAPITNKAFNATPPWVTLIDANGFIRAEGDPADPAFQYAVRAAVAEARGDYPPLNPRTLDGKEAVPGAKKPVKPKEPAGDKEKNKNTAAQKPEKKNEPAAKKPSDPEAKAKLDQARLYMRTGKRTDAKALFQEIVQNYPGTPEAEDAQYRLESMP